MKFLNKAKEADILPNPEDVLEDEWLQNLKTTDFFSNFIFKLKEES